MAATPRKRPRLEVDAITPSKLDHPVNGRLNWPEANKEENLLRAFDLALRYGPCRGLTREQRWQRALKLGLQPQPEILAALKVQDTQKSILDEHCI